MSIKDSDVTDNGGYGGVYLYNSEAEIFNCKFHNNGWAGIDVIAESIAKIGYNVVTSNPKYGIFCGDNGSTVIMLNSTGYPHCGYNNVENNDEDGIWAVTDGCIHLGRDSNRQGHNMITNNAVGDTYYDVKNSNNDTLFARYNYWNYSSEHPEPADSQFYGTVDSSHWLVYEGEGFVGWSSPFVQNKQGSKGVSGGEPEGPGGNNVGEAYRLKNAATDLFLDGEYYTAIDTFKLILDDYPGTVPARYALNHIVVCYREADNYEGAVQYLNGYLQQPPDTTLIDLAMYHKVLNLARLHEYQNAVAIAGNTQITCNWAQNLVEPTLIELGMIYKYGMESVAAGDSVFRAFLNQYPESHLAHIAAAELGIPWEPRDTMGNGLGGVIKIEDGLPKEFALHQNFPNPFNSSTTIRYDLPELADVTMKIYNIMGREVATLVDRKETAGYKRIIWNGVNNYGGEISSGVYILQMITRGESGKRYVRAQKMLLIK